MPQARDIKRRIASVKNTQQITRAMKMVATAKLRRVQERMEAMRPYTNALRRLLGYVAVDLVGDEHPFFAPRVPKRTLYIAIAGDRGLCGGFNSNLLRFAIRESSQRPQMESVFFAIGKRAIGGLKKTGRTLLHAYADVFDKLSYLLAEEICDRVLELFSSSDPTKRVDEVHIVFNSFHSVLVQRPTVKTILPIPFATLVAERKAEIAALPPGAPRRPIYEIEPDAETMLGKLILYRLAIEVQLAMLESYTAELAARMTAMDNATNNAEEMIERLTMDYNRARQAGITAELLDIIGGANALA